MEYCGRGGQHKWRYLDWKRLNVHRGTGGSEWVQPGVIVDISSSDGSWCDTMDRLTKACQQ